MLVTSRSLSSLSGTQTGLSFSQPCAPAAKCGRQALQDLTVSFKHCGSCVRLATVFCMPQLQQQCDNSFIVPSDYVSHCQAS